MALWCMRIVLLLGVAFAMPVAARALELPPGPLTAALQLDRERGVERSEALARALMQQARGQPRAERARLLDAACALDPGLVEAHLARARAALSAFDVPGAVAAGGNALDALRLDARARAAWTARGAHGLHSLLAAMLGVLALLHALRGLPLARHALGERLGSRAAALLLLVVPCIAALMTSLAIGTLVLLLVFGTFIARRDRILLAVIALSFALFDGILPVLAPDAVLLDPRTTTARIAVLNDGTDADVERRLRMQTERSSAVEMVLGLQARRRGDYDSAYGRFLAALHADSTNATAYLNLANVFFRAQQYERATAGYRAASALDPRDPIAHANLAQTYIRGLQYAESDHELRMASDLGFDAVAKRRAPWRDDAQPVLDRTLDAAQIRSLARREARADPVAARARMQAWRCGIWRNVRADVAHGLLLAVALLLLSRKRAGTLVSLCPECGMPLCTHCVALAPDDDRCSMCQVRRPRMIPYVALDETFKPTSRRRMSLATGRWVGALFPGAADLVRGAPAAGLIGVGIGCAALLVAHAVVTTARLQATPWTLAVDAGLLRLALLALFLVWLPGLLRLRNRDDHVRVVGRPTAPGA